MEPQARSKRIRKENDNLTANVNATKPEASYPDKDSSDEDMGQQPGSVSIDANTKHLCFMLCFDPGCGNQLEKLKSFSQHETLNKLKSIDIDLTHTIEESNDNDDEIAVILNRILKAGADCLEVITMRSPIGYLPNVVFPVMKNVIQLELQFYWWGSDATNFTDYLRGGAIFPNGFKFSVLPKLDKVTIKLQAQGQNPQYNARFDCWKNNLKSCGIAESVKRIQYNDNCEFPIERLETTFPNGKWFEYPWLNTIYVSSSEESSDESSEEFSDEQSSEELSSN